MPYATFTTAVNAPINVLWQLLIDKIENPQKYVPGVSDVKILVKNNDYVLREMTIPTGIVKEKITHNEASKEVIFTLVDHPLFCGTVINKIHVLPANNDSISLEFTLDWQPLDPDKYQDKTDMSELIKEAVLHTKELAENANL